MSNCTLHKYLLSNIAGAGKPKYLVYKCVKCPHYVQVNLALGRKSECWKCGKEMLVLQYHVTRGTVKPKHVGGCPSDLPTPGLATLPLPTEFLSD